MYEIDENKNCIKSIQNILQELNFLRVNATADQK